MAEPIDMQFGMLSRVEKEKMYGDLDGPQQKGIFGVSGRLKSNVKHRIWDMG